MSQLQDKNIASGLTDKSGTTAPAQASLQTKTSERFASTKSTKSAAIGRWLDEKPRHEHWNAMARLDSKNQGTARIAPRI
jgi:hypothetical protein